MKNGWKHSEKRALFKTNQYSRIQKKNICQIKRKIVKSSEYLLASFAGHLLRSAFIKFLGPVTRVYFFFSPLRHFFFSPDPLTLCWSPKNRFTNAGPRSRIEENHHERLVANSLFVNHTMVSIVSVLRTTPQVPYCSIRYKSNFPPPSHTFTPIVDNKSAWNLSSIYVLIFFR